MSFIHRAQGTSMNPDGYHYTSAIRLTNQKDASSMLGLTQTAWFGLLDLAQDYGWTPLGMGLPGPWDLLDLELAGYSPVGVLPGDGQGETPRAWPVGLEDALGLADALEQAFLDYEPRRVPASYYLFEPNHSTFHLRPSIGAINELAEFCRQGAFWIEPFR
jgi:hypothetical protein